MKNGVFGTGRLVEERLIYELVRLSWIEVSWEVWCILRDISNGDGSIENGAGES